MERISKMLKRCVASTMVLAPMVVLASLICAPLAGAQTGAKRESGKDIHRDGWDRPVPDPVKGQKSDPAPVHDLTGIWEPTPGYRDGVQATGAKENPSDGKQNYHFTSLGVLNT